jgi:hypothetical protein
MNRKAALDVAERARRIVEEMGTPVLGRGMWMRC